MVHMVRIASIIGVLVLLTACGGDPGTITGATTQSPADGSSPTGSAQPSETQQAAATGGTMPLAMLTRSGGMLGKTETLAVLSDGSLRLIEGESGGQPFKEGRATAEQIARLEAAVQSDGWRQLEASYGRQVPDGYSYVIVANSQTITTYDGATRPPLLENVLEQLNNLWQQALQS